MAIHRPLSGLAWFLIAAAGLFLLRPELFPDLRAPVDGEQRLMMGMLLVLVAAALAVAAAIDTLSRRDAPKSAPSYAGPMLGPGPGAQAPPEPEPSAPSVERAWTPLPPPRLVATGPTPAAEQPREVVGDASVAALDAPPAEPTLEQLEATAEERRAAAAAEPDAAGPGEALAASLAALADRHEGLGQPDRARALYAEAVGLRERLSWLEPESDVRRAALDEARARLETLRPAETASEVS